MYKTSLILLLVFKMKFCNLNNERAEKKWYEHRLRKADLENLSNQGLFRGTLSLTETIELFEIPEKKTRWYKV